MLAGLLLSFIIGFNEFTIIIFVYGPKNLPASVWLWNMLHMYGITPQFAAAVTVMQLVSFAVLFVLVRVIGRRYLQGRGVLESDSDSLGDFGSPAPLRGVQ